MSFIADKQTLDDLNLLGKYKPGSIYGLFNQVQTRGGERLLDNMFRHPLSDPKEINERAGIFKYLQGRNYTFPFDGQQFSLVEDYLGGGDGGNMLITAAGVLRKRLMETLVKDEAYGIVLEGVQTTLAFINIARDFIRQFDEKDPANPLKDQISLVKTVLADKRIAGLPTERKPVLTSWQKVAGYHHLFRHVLQDELTQLCETLHTLDLYIAVSKVAREKDFSYARALPAGENTFSAADLRHPCLERAVGNPVSLHEDSNVLFLTGANMAGKSTLMKSFGISVYLAHMGFPVAASDMVFSVKEGLFSSINVPDNLAMGYSHFYAEVQRVKSIAEEVGQSKDLVVIFDELFKGTNVKDAYDATLAVTEAFSEYSNCFFIISTHITEVGETLRDRRDNLQLVYLPTVMEGTRPKYTYRLEEGISTDRHGMMIIENEGILEII